MAGVLGLDLVLAQAEVNTTTEVTVTRSLSIISPSKLLVRKVGGSMPRFYNPYFKSLASLALNTILGLYRYLSASKNLHCVDSNRLRRKNGQFQSTLRAPSAFCLYQLPELGIELQGSAGGRAGPSCSSSIEMPSGDLTKAMRPSRGGLSMLTPPFCSLWHEA